jgi:hypothetical protein
MSSENDEQETAMSPLVTAQDRKRMILERRRKERDAFSNAANTTTSQSADTSAIGIKRRRSDTRSKRLFSSTDEGTSRSTLYGAVMQRTHALATPTKILHDDASTTTPSRVSWENTTTTPLSSSRSKAFLSANSPGGFALLKVLDSVASPFRHKDEEAKDEITSPIKNRLEEWQEAPLGGIIDWSMKRKLLMECHPGSCLPGGADWEEATRYWQHPAMHPLPQLDEEGGDMSQSVSASMHPLAAVQGRNDLMHRLVRQDPRLWRQRRNREWQEAFRSLYFNWLNQVEILQRQEQACCPKEITETYFYVMAPGQVVLFRIGMEEDRLVPVIVMSSSTHHLRSKLRSMGAKLLYYSQEREEFNEECLDKKKPATEDEANELEELRRAQAHGETAGADVSIATKKASSKPKSVPPLCVVGDDGCAAFFEFYLNTFGRCDTCWRTCNGDVPLLLSRKIGPYQHASLQTLAVSNRRSTDSQQNDPHAAIELRGSILPCALQELVSTAARRMMQDTTEEKSQPSPDDNVGSHYFVVQVQTHDEKVHATPNDKGTAGSGWLNNGATMSGKLEAAPSECEHGQVVGMIVWDVVRPNMIAYKTEPAAVLVP